MSETPAATETAKAPRCGHGRPGDPVRSRSRRSEGQGCDTIGLKTLMGLSSADMNTPAVVFESATHL